MNKTAIKNFAVWARRKLIADITYKAGMLGITEKGIAKPLPQSTSDFQLFDIGLKEPVSVSGRDINVRNQLVEAIMDKARETNQKAAFEFIVEKVAYTWFNRLIAIRFMEVNEYLPSKIRVLSSEFTGKAEPDIVTTPFDTDILFTTAEADDIQKMKDESRLDELFRMLFIKQCKKLHDILPNLFEEMDTYAEMLLTLSFTDKDGIVRHLVGDIPEEDFNVSVGGQVEIIGWLYQYWNTEPKDQVFANLKKNIKISKDNIPAATQLFTPDWIVRYMVENSLGRLWIEGHPNEELKANWKYYLEEAEQEPAVLAQLTEIRKGYAAMSPEDIKVIDPCMGSGHILIYLFDVLMQIYESQGWTQRDAAQSILRNNIYGLDIDDRAAQLAYFAVMMKARQYDRRLFSRNIFPNVFAIQESNSINLEHLSMTSEEEKIAKKLCSLYYDAKTYGSVLNVPSDLIEEIDALSENAFVWDDTLFVQYGEQLTQMCKQARVMGQLYNAIVTNPPYMGYKGMPEKLVEYVNRHYQLSNADLFAVCIEKFFSMISEDGCVASINPQSFMFLSSFEDLRRRIINEGYISSMAHMGFGAFGNDFGTTAFCIKRIHLPDYIGSFVRLEPWRNVDDKERHFHDKDTRYTCKNNDFSTITGCPYAYWLSTEFKNAFKAAKLSDQIRCCKGHDTGKNDRFLRCWHEVSFPDINHRWIPYNKGGDFRKWYGNRQYVVDWKDNGSVLRSFPGSNMRNTAYQGKECFTWSTTTAASFSCRYCEPGFMFDSKGCSGFSDDKNMLLYAMGALNSTLYNEFLKIITPTVDYNPGPVSRVPHVIADSETVEAVVAKVEENICYSREDWDSYETSWNFKEHPLLPKLRVGSECVFIDKNGTLKSITHMAHKLSDCYDEWERVCSERYHQLSSNEEELNRIFISIYGLQDELTPEVEGKDITVHKADLTRDIKSLISYAVGCMFGRYSLDEDGLAYAGGEWDRSKYYTYIPDDDNCLPITDEDYGLKDDVVNRFVDWIRVVYGEASLEENLKFIADALGNTGATPRETIRKYFLTDFFKDHCQTYSVTGSGKRPIYWLFDSGKQNGFKALVYMHRWSADTVGNLRVEYLHRMQRVYESEIERMQDLIENAGTVKERTAASKRKDKLTKQLKETRDYDAKIAHIALTRPTIDLDDGIKVNYEKVQQGPDGKSLAVLAKL